jgi:SAM-dependent methyltransferase
VVGVKTPGGVKAHQEHLRDYLQWDIGTWQHALYYWDTLLENRQLKGRRALDLGARDGGLSLYLAEKGMRVVCSDVQGPTQAARDLHRHHALDDQVKYQAINATEISFEDQYFDVVIFKSILGGIGTAMNYAAIQKAVREMHRVLKPGGLLLFAENQRGSRFHQKARSMFVPWGNTWYYPALSEIEELLAVFSSFEVYTYGFFSCIKKDFAPFIALDRLVCGSPKSHRHYMAFGHALKEGDYLEGSFGEAIEDDSVTPVV